MTDTYSKRKIVEDIRREIEASRESHIWSDYINALKLISQVVFTRSSGFILELIQNAEDSGLELPFPGSVQIRMNDRRVKFVHNGRPFSEANVRALCGIRSSKKPERGTLGYLGIGFKSVFKVTDRPEVYSDGFQFKFDRNHEEWGDPTSTPWHVLPIWLGEPSEPIESGQTTFVIPLRQGIDHKGLVEEVEKLRTELYLFLRWLKKVEAIDEISGRSWTLENVGEDEHGIVTLRREREYRKFRFFRRTLTQIPDWVRADRLTQEYRANVTQREIAIAFALDAKADLDPSEAGAMYGGVYSFLPLGEAKSGAKFPIQADFLVQPGRDAINYEAKWNHWLVQEVANLCNEAIAYFKSHERWRYQFLPAFAFTKAKGFESYDKLFGPKLIAPLEKFLGENSCVPTAGGGWGRLKDVVRLTERPEAAKDLVEMGVLESEQEIAAVLGGQEGLKLADSNVIDSDQIRRVNRWDLLKNEDFLRRKSQVPKAAQWFRALYLWLNKHPDYEDYFYYKRRKRLRTYHEYHVILTSDRRLLKGGDVYLLDLSSADPLIGDLVKELEGTKPMLHSDVMGGPTSEHEQKGLRGFLTGLAGVQVLDTKAVCKEALLPRILTSSPKPALQELLRYTVYCRQILGEDIGKGAVLWVVTKNGDIRTAKEVLFSSEFKPEQNWEIHQRYVVGLSFLGPEYVAGVTNDAELKSWRDFFGTGGIKDAPDNGVEEFAVNYAREQLSAVCKKVMLVDKRNYGYDIEAESQAGERMRVEVKGQSQDHDVELTGNEADAADRHKDTFYLCVVASIPVNSRMHMLRNPAAVGKRDKLSIPVSIWKSVGWP